MLSYCFSPEAVREIAVIFSYSRADATTTCLISTIDMIGLHVSTIHDVTLILQICRSGLCRSVSGLRSLLYWSTDLVSKRVLMGNNLDILRPFPVTPPRQIIDDNRSSQVEAKTTYKWSRLCLPVRSPIALSPPPAAAFLADMAGSTLHGAPGRRTPNAWMSQSPIVGCCFGAAP